MWFTRRFSMWNIVDPRAVQLCRLWMPGGHDMARHRIPSWCSPFHLLHHPKSRRWATQIPGAQVGFGKIFHVWQAALRRFQGKWLLFLGQGPFVHVHCAVFWHSTVVFLGASRPETWTGEWRGCTGSSGFFNLLEAPWSVVLKVSCQSGCTPHLWLLPLKD